jgi:hypothetical protein
MFTLYVLINPLDHAPFYVGITQKADPLERLAEHLADPDESVKARKIKEITQAGLQPVMAFFGKYADEPAARNAERSYQNFFHQQGLTLTNGEITKLNHAMAGKETGKTYTEDDKEQIVALFRQGKSAYDISVELERSYNSIRAVLDKITYTISVPNAFAIKDELKARGYRFAAKGKNKNWEIYLLREQLDDEMAFLKEKGQEFNLKKPN